MKVLSVVFFFWFLASHAVGQACEPTFSAKEGWLGADAAYSIPLPDGRSVWIFGDTPYGDRRVVNGDEPRMVRNSIGISSCNNGKWDIDYVIRGGAFGTPRDFFQAKSPYWYWALDGFTAGDDLWVTLLCLKSVPKSNSFNLGFATCGSDLARVSGLQGDPQKWNVTIYPLVKDGVKACPSATTVVEGKYVYLFALYEIKTRPMVVARIALNQLNENPAANMEYLAKSGMWKKGFKPADAKEVMEHGNTEMTIRYHQEHKRWLAVMNDPDLATGRIILRTAPELTGPWSEGQVIYTIPEMQKNDPSYDVDNYCYAGKEHPEFREDDSILVTYACNTLKVKKLETMQDIYFPKPFRYKLPPLN